MHDNTTRCAVVATLMDHATACHCCHTTVTTLPLPHCECYVYADDVTLLLPHCC